RGAAAAGDERLPRPAGRREGAQGVPGPPRAGGAEGARPGAAAGGLPGAQVGFGAFLGAAQALTPYATRFRSPDGGGRLDPPRAEAEQAVRLAEGIVRFVQQRI